MNSKQILILQSEQCDILNLLNTISECFPRPLTKQAIIKIKQICLNHVPKMCSTDKSRFMATNTINDLF